MISDMSMQSKGYTGQHSNESDLITQPQALTLDKKSRGSNEGVVPTVGNPTVWIPTEQMPCSTHPYSTKLRSPHPLCLSQVHPCLLWQRLRKRKRQQESEATCGRDLHCRAFAQ